MPRSSPDEHARATASDDPTQVSQGELEKFALEAGKEVQIAEIKVQ